MDDINKRISSALDSMGRSQFIRYVSIYLLVVGVISLCGGVLLFVAGAAAGVSGAIGASAINGASSTDAQQAQQALGAAAAFGGLAALYGILDIISGPAMIVVGLGLRSRAPWSRMGVVVIGGIHVIVSLIGLFVGNGGILSLLWIIGDALVVYIFYAEPGVKAEFGDGKAKM